MRRTRTALCLAGPAVAAAALALTGAGAAVARPVTIAFGQTTCMPTWAISGPGAQRFTIKNNSQKTATVYLFRSDSGAVLSTTSGLKPGDSATVKVRLTAGLSYGWSCDLKNTPVHLSEAEKVPAEAQQPSTIPPVVNAELTGPLKSYERYVRRLETRLTAQVSDLRAELAADQIGSARAAWLAAHETWLKIGQDDQAYGAFGDLGASIDGIGTGYRGGAANPRFSGFHRIERDLWTRHDRLAALADATTLVRLVRKLTGTPIAQWMPGSTVGLTNFTLRVHEVLEDAERDCLSGEDDFGSHTELATLAADITATREFLSLLSPDLAPRAPNIAGRSRAALNVLSDTIAAVDRSHPHTALRKLPRRTRDQLNAAVGGAVETLAPIPDLLALGGT